jgi:hypothetical protein
MQPREADSFAALRNDSKKSKGNGNGNGNGRSRFPEGMAARKARATATEEADSRRE